MALLSDMIIVHAADQADAEAVGRAAVDAAVAGRGGRMVTLLPLDRDAPGPQTGSAPLAELVKARSHETVAITISDITRPVPNRIFLPPMLEVLAAAGEVLVPRGLDQGPASFEALPLTGAEFTLHGGQPQARRRRQHLGAHPHRADEHDKCPEYPKRLRPRENRPRHDAAAGIGQRNAPECLPACAAQRERHVLLSAVDIVEGRFDGTNAKGRGHEELRQNDAPALVDKAEAVGFQPLAHGRLEEDHGECFTPRALLYHLVE